MTFHIFKEEPTKEPEKKVYLRLIKDGNDIRLIACDESGNKYHHGNLLEISSDGKVGLFDHVNADLDFACDEGGYLKTRML